jgi:hypothetical protein
MIVELENVKRHQLSSMERVNTPQTKEWSCPSQLHKEDVVRRCRAGVGERRTFSVDPDKRGTR